MQHRNIMRIELTAPAKRAVEKLSEHYGMTQVTIMSRLIEWFGHKDEVTRSSLVQHMGDRGGAETVKQILRKMTDR